MLEISLGHLRLTLNAAALACPQLSHEILHHHLIRQSRKSGVWKRRESSRRVSMSSVANARGWTRSHKLPSIASVRGRRHRSSPSKSKFVRDAYLVSYTGLWWWGAACRWGCGGKPADTLVKEESP